MESKKRFLLKRKIEVLKIFFLSRVLRKEALRIAAQHLYTKAHIHNSSLPSTSLEEILPQGMVITLAPYSRIDGNLSYYELMVLSSFVKAYQPIELLEIGTFNGLSTLHMALNAPTEARIHTLDLLHIDALSYPPDESDIDYILDQNKCNKKYDTYPDKRKILEHQGNSCTYPFALFGSPNLIFIDGGHSYHHVRNDTEQSLAILKRPGIILWHDYTPDCPGVFQYVNELCKLYPVQHIQGTSLVYLKY